MKTFLAFIFIISSNYSLYSISLSDSLNFLPLQVGNKFTYFYYSHDSYTHTTITYYRLVKVLMDSIILNRKYFYCENAPWGGSGWFRTDTVNRCIFKFDPANSCSTYYNYEKLIDSIGYSLGNSRCNYMWYRAEFTNNVIFGQPSVRFYVNVYTGLNTLSYHTYHLNFGYTKYSYSAQYYQATWDLLGCEINGVVYGDTTIPLGVNVINNSLPSNFSLSQNYPNPFNPQTKIKFSIPLSRGVTAEGGRGVFVSLIIYDLLGREVTTLVNEELKPGTYEVDWDGSNYSSGVYFYKLEAGDFTETKKMVLMK